MPLRILCDHKCQILAMQELHELRLSFEHLAAYKHLVSRMPFHVAGHMVGRLSRGVYVVQGVRRLQPHPDRPPG